MRTAFLLLALLSSPLLQAQLEFEFGGLTRTYYMDAPDPIPEGAPLVFVLHGYGSSAATIRTYSGWGDLAIDEGFVAVFPQGTQDNFNVPHWNANLGLSTTNDHGFLAALAEYLQEQHSLSAECTFSCGMSNGGFMSYSLACVRPDVFAAIGSVTGAMSTADFGCTPSEVIPIIHLHGTDDNVVSYEDGTGGSWGTESVPDIIEHWTGLMGTTVVEETELPNQELLDQTTVDFLRYSGAPAGQEFHHYRVNGGGHDWFGTWGSQDVDATTVMWEFFKSTCNGEFTDVAIQVQEARIIERNGNGIQAQAPCTVEVLNVLGQTLVRAHLMEGDIWRPSTKDLYLFRALDDQGRKQVLRIR